MILIKREDYSSTFHSRTVYTVETERGLKVSVMRKRFTGEEEPTWYCLDPASVVKNDKGVIAFVKRNADEKDIMRPTLVRVYKGTNSEIRETYPCYERGVEVAEEIWKKEKGNNMITRFELCDGVKVVKSWVRK